VDCRPFAPRPASNHDDVVKIGRRLLKRDPLLLLKNHESHLDGSRARTNGLIAANAEILSNW
jgi:hypothetical protein